MQRRDFLGALAAMGLGGLAAGEMFADDAPDPTETLLRRPFRPGGPELSIIGFGGLLLRGMQPDHANGLVGWAVDRGCNYFDIAPSYGDSIDLLGPALEPYRDDCFLACKTTKRDATGAREELEDSLAKLRTDHVDLYQIHALTSMDDVAQVMAPGGALETFAAAREEGKVGAIGFSAHSEEAALAAMDQFAFDSVLFPLNCVCIERGNFGPALMAKAAEQNVAMLAIKSLAWTPVPKGEDKPYPNCWYRPIHDPNMSRLSLTYTLDLPVTAAVSPAAASLFVLAMQIGLRYRPLSDDERARLIGATEGVTPIFPH